MFKFGKKKAAQGMELEQIRQAVDVSLPTKDDLEALSKAGVQPAETPVRLLGTEPEQPAEQKPTTAPLFVKLDRYNNILVALSEIKKGLEAIKNVFSYVSELENLKSDSFRMLHDMVERIDKKLLFLDSEFIKPPEFADVSKKVATKTGAGVYAETAGLEDIIKNMKNKIEDIRGQIETV